MKRRTCINFCGQTLDIYFSVKLNNDFFILDLPDEYTKISNYNATLGHKVTISKYLKLPLL